MRTSPYDLGFSPGKELRQRSFRGIRHIGPTTCVPIVVDMMSVFAFIQRYADRLLHVSPMVSAVLEVMF